MSAKMTPQQEARAKELLALHYEMARRYQDTAAYDAWRKSLTVQDDELLTHAIDQELHRLRLRTEHTLEEARQAGKDLASKAPQLDSLALATAARQLIDQYGQEAYNSFTSWLLPEDQRRLEYGYQESNRQASLARAQRLRQEQEARSQQADIEARAAFEAVLKDEAWRNWQGTREAFESAWPDLLQRLLVEGVTVSTKEVQETTF